MRTQDHPGASLADDIARGERLLAAGHAEAALAAFRPIAISADAAARAQGFDGLSRALLALERPAAALAYADQALAARFTPAVQANRARVLLRLGRIDEALAAADATLAREPVQARALAVRDAARSARGEAKSEWAPLPAKVELAKSAADALAAVSDAMRIGVAWECDRAHDPAMDDPPGTPGARRNSATLDLCLRYLALGGARLVVLRRGPADRQTRRLVEMGLIVDPYAGRPEIDDAAMAAAIGKLDLVVAVDSRAAELAGLLGKPGIVMLPTGAIGRWPQAWPGGDPQRKSLSLFRQSAPGDWDAPFRTAGEGVAAMLRGRPRPPAKPVMAKAAKQAQVLIAEGNKAHEAGDAAGAARAWRQGLALNPRLSSAWGNIGVALRVEGYPEAAVACYRIALGIGMGEAASTIGNMGNALKDLDRLDDAIAMHRKAVELDSKKASTHHNLGISYRQAGRYREAIPAFERALELRAGWTSAMWDLALVRLHIGEFAKGWPLYEARWNLPEMAMPKLGKPLWNGEKLDGRGILIHSEQGFGDAIQCVRYAGALKAAGAARVIVDCKPPLVRLFQSVEGVDLVVPRGQRVPEYDFHCPIASLPGRFVTDTTTIPGRVPFLKAPPGAAAKFAQALSLARGRLKVGIVWSGSVTFKDNHHRATTLARFLEHFGLPEISLFSLQKGPREDEMKALGPDAPVIDMAPLIDDFADTAALIEQLDLVLMTDSSVAHLCGALNRPVWVLLPYHAHWLWLENDRDTTPWYPSMRFFRQPKTNDWDTPFARAGEELMKLARRHSAAPVPA